MRFKDPRLNTAAARLEFEGRWDFGHDKYREIGWEPFHYFPRAGSFEVQFSYQGAGDKTGVDVNLNQQASRVQKHREIFQPELP